MNQKKHFQLCEMCTMKNEKIKNSKNRKSSCTTCTIVKFLTIVQDKLCVCKMNFGISHSWSADKHWAAGGCARCARTFSTLYIKRKNFFSRSENEKKNLKNI